MTICNIAKFIKSLYGDKINHKWFGLRKKFVMGQNRFIANRYIEFRVTNLHLVTYNVTYGKLPLG